MSAGGAGLLRGSGIGLVTKAGFEKSAGAFSSTSVLRCDALSARAARRPQVQGVKPVRPATLLHAVNRRRLCMRRQYALRLVSRAGWRACSILAVQVQMQSGGLMGSGVRLLGILQPASDPVVRGSLQQWRLYICISDAKDI